MVNHQGQNNGMSIHEINNAASAQNTGNIKLPGMKITDEVGISNSSCSESNTAVYTY